jgi:hypothetical protein
MQDYIICCLIFCRVDVLLKAVEKGKIKRARLEENTRRVFVVMLRRMEKRV